MPKAPITPHAAPTELALSGTWDDINSNDLAAFDCVEADVDYNVATQNGFIGTGGGVFGFLHSDPLMITVEIHSDATDIHFSSTDTHDIDLGAVRPARRDVADRGLRANRRSDAHADVDLRDARAERRGRLDLRAQGRATARRSTSPSRRRRSTSTSPATCWCRSARVDLEASATVHLLFDWAMGVAEGELFGHVDCDAVVAGLRGEGQLTWHVGPAMQYMQGRMKVAVFTRWSAAGSRAGSLSGTTFPRHWPGCSTPPIRISGCRGPSCR